MRRAAQPVRIGYFGKLPAHSDFIKTTDNFALAALLDQWLAEAMVLLTAEPRWKRHYDALSPLHFAIVGTRSKRAIAGRIAASCDQSRRRFPFLAMSMLEIEEPARFVPRSPLVLANLWHRVDALCAPILAGPNPHPDPALRELAACVVEIDPNAARHDDDFFAFLDNNTLHSLQAMLAPAGFHGAMRQLIIALGLLLGPVRENNGARLEKSLLLPLPRESGQRALVAGFWLDLIAPFLLDGDFELALFLTQQDGQPVMVIGFSGAAPHTLQALIDPAVGATQQIAFGQMDWVESQIGADHKVQRLSACLAQGQLSLRSARQLFQETFL